MLDAALAKRAIGAPIGEVEEIPADEAYGRTIAALGELLVDLTPAEWDAPTIEGWTVKGLVTHLVAVEEYFGRQLGLWPLEIDEALEADHLGMTRAFVAAWSERPAAEVLGPLAGAHGRHHHPPGRARPRRRPPAVPLPLPRHLALDGPHHPGLRDLDPRRGHPSRHRPRRVRPRRRPASGA